VDDEAVKCRSAARRARIAPGKCRTSIAKSVWYFSDAQWVGFRVVRPLKVPPAEQMQKYWTAARKETESTLALFVGKNTGFRL